MTAPYPRSACNAARHPVPGAAGSGCQRRSPLALLAVPLLGAACSPLDWLSGRYPEVVFSVDTAERAVAFTIDDSPAAGTTTALLDLLAAHDAKATFFVITDRVTGHEAVLERLVDEGHEIGNHLVHDEPSIDLPPEEFARQLRESHAVLTRFAPVRWFRPGSGWFNARMLETLEHQGYRLALGSVYPFDPQLPWPWLAKRYITASVEPGSIVVLHDGAGRGQRTQEILAEALPRLAARGFRFVTVSELVALGGRRP